MALRQDHGTGAGRLDRKCLDVMNVVGCGGEEPVQATAERSRPPDLRAVLRANGNTTAVHLLRAGVDINTIRAWLGHVSLETTNRYAEVDLEMKAKALATCALSRSPTPLDPATANWKQDRELMTFLTAL